MRCKCETGEFPIKIIQGDTYRRVYQFYDSDNNLLTDDIIDTVILSVPRLTYTQILNWDADEQGYVFLLDSDTTAQFPYCKSTYDVTLTFIDTQVSTEVYQSSWQIFNKDKFYNDITDNKGYCVTDESNVVIKTGIKVGGSGGVSDHRLLDNRDAEDQHPISAITGLEEELNNKQDLPFVVNITVEEPNPKLLRSILKLIADKTNAEIYEAWQNNQEVYAVYNEAHLNLLTATLTEAHFVICTGESNVVLTIDTDIVSLDIISLQPKKIIDEGNYYRYNNIEDALQEIGEKLTHITPFVVNIVKNEDETYTADKTNSEIYEAWQNKQLVYVAFEDIKIIALTVKPNAAFFGCIIYSGGTIAETSAFYIESNVVQAFSTDLQATTILDEADYYTHKTVEGAFEEIGNALEVINTTKQSIPLIVNITSENANSHLLRGARVFVADKTNAEIYEAWQAEREIIASLYGGVAKLSCIQCDEVTAYFVSPYSGDEGSLPTIGTIVIDDSTGTQTVNMNTAILQPSHIVDAADYYTNDTVEGALQEIGAKLSESGKSVFIIDYSNPKVDDYTKAIELFNAGGIVRLRKDNVQIPMTGYETNHCFFGGTVSAYLPGGYVIAVYAHIGTNGQNYFWYQYNTAVEAAGLYSEDAGNYFTSSNVMGQLQEIGAKLAAYPSDVWQGGTY